jgi:endonuclease YncB( thermonuclease family)
MNMVRLLLSMIILIPSMVCAAYPPVLTEVIPKEPSIVDTCIGAWVAKVVDGDTIAIQVQNGAVNISIYGIVAPRDGAWARKAKEYLTWRVERKNVALEIMGRDTQGRVSCRVYQAGSDIGLSLVALGLAKSAPTTDEVVAKSEKAAKARGIGMWGSKK